jgi:hypothetical protein
MTDVYGSEPRDHEAGHDEVLTHEQDVVHEPPSDYEFSDDQEGAAAVEEHAEEHSIAAETGPAPRSPWLLVAVGGGIIVLLGGVAWWQFGSGLFASSAPSSPTAALGNVPAMPPLSSAPPSAPGGPLVTRPTPDQIAASTVAPRTSSALSAPDAQEVTPLAPAAPSPALPAPISVNPAASSAPVAEAPVSAGTVPVQVRSPATTGGDDPRIAALTARLDDLQKSLNQETQQLGQVTNMVAANTAASPTSSKDLQDRLDKIEQQLAKLHHPAPVLATPSSLPGAAPVAEEAQSAAAPVSSHPAKHAKHHAAARKARSHVQHAIEANTSAPAQPIWVLRAASPGQAWVADSVTSRDLKALHVGDSLPGVGRVTAIQQQGGAWIVQGTGGTVR